MLEVFNTLLISATHRKGYFLTVSTESAALLGKHALETNKHFCLNLSAPFIPQFFKKDLDSLEPYWDVIFGNETEAGSYAESHELPSKEPKDVALYLSSLPTTKSRKRMAVITQGTQPTLVAFDGKVTEYAIIPVKPENVVDTTGAGDAFVGGFLAQYVQGKSVEVCVKAGHYCASVCVQRPGPTFPDEPHKFSA